MQGYYFSAPVHATEVEQMLRAGIEASANAA
jgi:EAL domain-containing protein (putative c-di-GMP-specific phosphodiesterase class I)